MQETLNKMHVIRIQVFFVIVCLISKQTVEAEESDLTKDLSITTKQKELKETKSQIEKRDSSGQTAIYKSLEQQRGKYSPNDEPFRPIYRPNYSGDGVSTKYFSQQTISPQSAEVYYDNSQASSNRGTSKVTLNAPSTSAKLSALSGTSLAGSFLSAGGATHYNTPAYRGFHQKEQIQTSQKTAAKQETSIAPATKNQENKRPNYNLFSTDTNVHDEKQNHQQQQHQPQFTMQPIHHPHYQQVYTPQQQAQLRAIPQHHVQYIVAIPLSYIRQLQQQQQQRHLLTTPQPFIGPLARDHYGAYRSVQNTNNVESGTTPTQQYPVQYTTQYIQFPTNVLHAAVQAAHNHQHRNQANSVTIPTYEHIQPQYFYYPHHHQQQQQQANQQQVQQAPIYGNTSLEKLKTQKSQQSATVHIGVAKPSSNNIQQKTARLLPTPTPAPALQILNPLTAHTPSAETIVHYNPLYVQAPPPEQQSLFSGINYHRFTAGGFQATTPVPFVRFSPVTPTYDHFYTTFPHHQQPQHPQTFYNTFAPQEIHANGLPYYTNPGGIHYGTHLFHPSTYPYLTTPANSNKNVEAAYDSNIDNQQ